MAVNIKSLQGRLRNVARESGVDFQHLLHRFGAEQFLFRVSISSLAEKFIFKGGTLLSYVINSDRKTRDLDFSVKFLNRESEQLPQIIQSILDIPVDDGIVWEQIQHSQLNHPEMTHPGIRIVCDFLLGEMRGQVRMDLAFEDVVPAEKTSLKRIRYKGIPLLGEDFDLFTYSQESIFSEKLQIAIKKGVFNTRMKDYYDLYKLCFAKLSKEKLKECLDTTFKSRKTDLPEKLTFEESSMTKLQEMWAHYLRKQRLHDAPAQIEDVMKKVNLILKGLKK